MSKNEQLIFKRYIQINLYTSITKIIDKFVSNLFNRYDKFLIGLKKRKTIDHLTIIECDRWIWK